MANPFGIEQVDIPSMLGMHQQMKRQRIADLMQAREYERQDRQEQRALEAQKLRQQVFQGQPKGGDPQSGGTGADMAPTSNAPASSPQLPPLDQPLPPRTDGLAVNMEALRELYAIDPQGAAQIQRLVHDSDKQQLEKAQARGEAMAVAATSLRNLPAGQRQAEFQRNWAPYLIERGYDPAMLQQADLSDDGLERYYRQGRSIEKIVSSAEGERDYRLRVQNQRADNARADAGLGIRERALKLAQQREGRLATGKGADGDNSDLNYLIGD